MIDIIEPVSFRDLCPDIPSTTYASHGMYFHPAKFIPQVVSWFIEEYTKKNDWIIDPFAGSGTLAVECLLRNRNAICLDLNPVVENIIAGKIFKGIDYSPIAESIANINNCSTQFYPSWSRITYWYHPVILNILQYMWGAYYKKPHPLVLLALFKTSRNFSYADESIPKICTTKSKRHEIDRLVANNEKVVEKLIQGYFHGVIQQIYKQSLSFTSYYRGGEVKVKGGIDLPNYCLDSSIDHLITSPPYGRAHEYIRSFKLELAWLGYGDKYITELGSKVIPYRKLSNDIKEFEMDSPTFDLYRTKINPKFIRDYDCYFKSVAKSLGNIMSMVKGYAGIFVGNATYGGIEPPYHQIFIEHFEKRGFTHERTLVDEIKSRKLFTGRKNASPSGIRREYLIVLKAK
jgi:hypothetical protein